MKELSISFETAKLAKEKKFDWLIRGYYVEYLQTQDSDSPAHRMTSGEIVFENEPMINHKVGDYSNSNYTMYSAPTQSQLQKWLRDTHNLYVDPYLYDAGDKGIWIRCCIHVVKEGDPYPITQIGITEGMVQGNRPLKFNTWEEALEAGLQAALHHLATDI